MRRWNKTGSRQHDLLNKSGKSVRKTLALVLAGGIVFSGISPINAQAETLKDAFNARMYSDSYRDLKEAFGEDEAALYNHYITFGLFENRNMSELINVLKYRQAYPDLDAAFGDNWDAYVDHYLTYGAYERRNSFGTFDAFAYADRYPDLMEAFGYDVKALWKHYVIFGRAEGRDCTTPVEIYSSEDSDSSSGSGDNDTTQPGGSGSGDNDTTQPGGSGSGDNDTTQPGGSGSTDTVSVASRLVDPETGAAIPNATLYFTRTDNVPSTASYNADSLVLTLEEVTTVSSGDAGGTVSGGDADPSTPSTPPTNYDAVAETDENGNYTVDLEPGIYSVVVLADGYIALTINSVVVNNGVASITPTIQLLSQNANGESSIAGRLTNALNGRGIEGVTVEFRREWGNYDGSVVATTTTDADGNFSYALARGYYTATFIKDGFVTKSLDVVSLTNATNHLQLEALTPEMAAESYRIVLTWGEYPRDLDSHITGPADNGDQFHVYYRNKIFTNGEGEDVVTLDYDDTTSFGPETVTIITPEDNAVYRYSVHNFSGSPDIRTSSAVVTVYSGSEQVAAFGVPVNGDEGRIWVVFEIRDGVIVPINTVCNVNGSSVSPEYFSEDLYTE